MHVTTWHFVSKVNNEFYLYSKVICLTPYPSTPRFHHQKWRTVLCEVPKGILLQNEIGRQIHPRILISHCILLGLSLLAISSPSLRL